MISLKPHANTHFILYHDTGERSREIGPSCSECGHVAYQIKGKDV